MVDVTPIATSAGGKKYLQLDRLGKCGRLVPGQYHRQDIRIVINSWRLRLEKGSSHHSIDCLNEQFCQKGFFQKCDTADFKGLSANGFIVDPGHKDDRQIVA